MKETQDVAALYNPSMEVPDAPSLICGMVRPLSREELIATIPAKPACDKLMARFFDEQNSPVPTYRVLLLARFLLVVLTFV